MVIIYKKRNFVIYDCCNDREKYIVCNMNKDFNKGHTHINNYNTAKYLIDYALNKQVPPISTSIYIIESLKRISKDKVYIDQLETLLKRKKTKKQKSKRCRY